MHPLVLGGIVALVTVLVLFSGISVATGLLAVSAGFLLIFDGMRSLELMPEILLGKLKNFALLSIPTFIIMGLSIASTRAAIGKMGLPEMRKHGYPDGVAVGSIAAGSTLGILIPPSVTMIVYGIATPSETAADGAILCLMVAMIIYKMWSLSAIWAVLRGSTRESVMILFIIGAAGVFSYMLPSLMITQSIAASIGNLDVNPWVRIGAINLFLLVADFFLPHVAVILMAAPILLPIVTEAGFDPCWFAVILTINMGIGLITPPVGLNLYVINGIAPDIKLKTILWGSIPFVGCMVLAIVILSIFNHW